MELGSKSHRPYQYPMILGDLRKQLPVLDVSTLDFILSHVYDTVNRPESQDERDNGVDERHRDLLSILLALQTFNYHHRMDEVGGVLTAATRSGRRFQSNSSGTELWLALLLAIKELFGLNDGELTALLRKTTVIK